MTVLMVPALDRDPWPTLGPQVCDFVESYLVFGPGDLRGEPARLDDEKRALIYRMYEVHPQGHELAGRRRFKRCAISLRKGTAKTELAAWLAACELHPDAPVRCAGFDSGGEPVGVGVRDPYIPMVAYTEEQSDELAYGALRYILQASELADDFDIGIERIMRIGGDGKAVSLSTSPDARDGARTTFQVFDEPLALDTPVPTTAGWKTMGDIAVGDWVYGRDGHPVHVVGVSPVHEGRLCYRVTFVGGDSVVTDGCHRWRAIDWANRPRGEQLVTTEAMLVAGIDTGYGKRWRLPRSHGYDGIEAELAIHPYVLGAWLGDGDATNATISVGAGDLDELVTILEGLGYNASRCETGDRAALLYVSDADGRYGHTVRGRLHHMGLMGNKHIPSRYLTASRQQRQALLQGLMDSDGYSTGRGTCTFVQKDRRMAEQVQLLIRSLGVEATVCAVTDSRSRTGLVHKVHFSPDFCPFRLARKAQRCPPKARRSVRWPAIESIEPCDSVPVRCIAVESDDHLFLVGEGLRLTHNTHRFTLPRLREAHRTMMANMPKRYLSDAWSFEITTAPAPGEGSVAEATMDYARLVADGQARDSQLFFFHRQASDEHDLSTPEGLRMAVIEASGPAATWSDIDGIVAQWADPTTDKAYLERVWLNRLVQASERAFDVERWKALATEECPAMPGDLITLGFDGARYHDSTALVATHVPTGYQWLAGLWEHPHGVETWEVPALEVEDAIADLFATYEVWRMYCDPPYWESYVSQWAGRYGEKRVMEWWTNRPKPMAYALRAYSNAMTSGEVSHDGSAGLTRHIGSAVRGVLRQRDDQGVPLWVIYKERPDSPHKIDAAMAAVLSWEARNDALASGEGRKRTSVYESRGLVMVRG